MALLAGCLGWGLMAGSWSLEAAAQERPAGTKASAPTALRDLNQRPEMQPLLEYLRCEKDVVNEFGESQPPLDALSAIPQADAMNDRGQSTFPLEVWRGIRGDVVIAAGYGFLAVMQHYPRGSRAALLSSLEAAGWSLQRTSLADADEQRADDSIVNALVAAHSAQRPLGDRTRRLTVVEAKLGLTPGEVDLDGLTVLCRYSNASTNAKAKRGAR